MCVVVALGGNALLRRGEPLTADVQRRNVKVAAAALACIVPQHNVVISHGNGPQVGLLSLQAAAYAVNDTYPLDILDAETEGMIGYLIAQELDNALPAERRCVALLTQVEVDPQDPAFRHPTKPIGPTYDEATALALARDRGWAVAPDGDVYRRVVASPRPKRIFELEVIRWLVDQGIIVISVGGGGIPVLHRADGSLIGVEAVIDKDFASALLARGLEAEALLLLTDVNAVYKNWGKLRPRAIRRSTVQAIRELAFEPGSMGPKVEAACEFVEQTGGIAGIGALGDAAAILHGDSGTVITADAAGITWWD